MKKNESTEIQRVAEDVETTSKVVGVGKTMVWGLIKSGELETITIGSRRLVLVESRKAYIERRRQAELTHRTIKPSTQAAAQASLASPKRRRGQRAQAAARTAIRAGVRCGDE